MTEMGLSSAAAAIIAKTDSDGEGGWLPLYYHLLDTARVIERLLVNWLPPAACQTMAGDLGEEKLFRVVVFLALVHDLGKATPAFQRKVAGLIENGLARLEQEGMGIPIMSNAKASPHALAGETLLIEAGVPNSLAAIIGAHHGQPTNGTDAIDIEINQLEAYKINYRGHGDSEKVWRQIQQEYLNWALELSGFSSVDELPFLSVPAQVLITGLLIMADWIASGTRYFPLISSDDFEMPYDMSRIDRAWERLSLSPAWMPDDFPGIDALCAARFGFMPNELQRAVMEIAADAKNPGILIVEAQMGAGKTEAALLAAEMMSDANNGTLKRGGIFFGLPTQATANGIFERIKKWGECQAQYAPATIRLAHGATELNETYTGLIKAGGNSASIDVDDSDASGLVVHEWFRGRKQALLSDFVVGTVDQLLMLALKQRHVMLRHLGMCGKVAIIDECHAYDAYMNQYLEAALRWLGTYHVPVILLSATMPTERRAALIDAYCNKKRRKRLDSAAWRICRDYPLLTWTNGEEVSQRAVPLNSLGVGIAIERLPVGLDETAEANALVDYIDLALRDGGCAGVIVNTVKRAQSFALALRERMPGYDVLLIHSQFVLPDRMTRERELLRRVGKNSTAQNRDRLIVVGTQVCEQSLDLDFDLLITDLCPMDLLLQRMGRLHRHRRHDSIRPVPLRSAHCLVMGACETLNPGSVGVYGEYLLLRTRALLPTHISLPADIPDLVQNTYDETVALPHIPKGYDAARHQYEIERKKRERRADTFRLQLSEISKTIDGLLDAGIGTDDEGERAVRDGDPSIEVLVLRRKGEGVCLLADCDTTEILYTDHVPDERTCRHIAEQKLRLPRALCLPCNVEKVIAALRIMNEGLLEWQQSPWLRGQLFLMLDENGTAKLDQWILNYDGKLGLLYHKEEAYTDNGI